MSSMTPTPHGEQPSFFNTGTAQSVFTRLLGMPVSLAMQEAVRLGIPDLLNAGPRHVDVLATTLHVDAHLLLLFLRALASVDLFQEIAEGIFAHTDASLSLCTDHSDSLSDLAGLLGTSWCRNAWAHLAWTLETGQPSFEQVSQMDLCTYLSMYPEEQRLFRRVMAFFSESLITSVLHDYDFSTVKTLVDVGNGDEHFLLALLKQYPTLQGLLLALPPLVEEARLAIEQAGLVQRCTCLTGNALESVPVGADVYFLKQVLRSWSDEHCVQLLSNCGNAMAVSGRVLVAEYVVPRPPQKPAPALFVELWMSLLRSGGYERTEAQLSTLFEQAGLELVRVWAPSSTYSLLEARKAQV